MPDSFTDLLRIRDQETGGNPTTWGTLTDDNFNMVEDAIAGMATISTTGGTYTLSTANATVDEARMAIVKVTGVLVSNSSVVVPTSTKQYIIWNATSEAYTVTIKTAAGTGVTISQSEVGTVFCDGTNVVRAGGGAASAIVLTPTGDVAATDVQTGIAELASEKANKNVVNTFTKAQSITPVALTQSGAGIATDASLSNIFTIQLVDTESTTPTLSNPTNLVEGTTYIWKITQDAGVACTLAYGTSFLFLNTNGIDPAISTTLSSINLLSCAYIGGTLICSLQTGAA